MRSPKILTGIDVPYGTPGGSVTLFADLYLAPDAPIQADAFMLSGAVDDPVPTNLRLLDVTGKASQGQAYSAYVVRLVDALRDTFASAGPELLHLHHLAFGASPALIDAFPDVPAIAFIHGTDILAAEANPGQHGELVRITDHVDAIVAPTRAMAYRLYRLAPHVDLDKVHHVSWGLPDRLFAAAPKTPLVDRRTLRPLYAGRLAPEKGFDPFIRACEAVGLPLSVAAPTSEWKQACQRLGRAVRGVNYLGWLRREELRREFSRHDVLVVPSLNLEAFCLTAIEAQAARLPVVYRAIDGLSDALGDSAMPTDLYDSAALAKTFDLLRSGALRNELSERGCVNVGRFRLSMTAAAVSSLSRRVVAARSVVAR